jgi:dolichol-phosphate mannosyltransferase
VVVTMADGSDDPEQIEPLCRLVERGVVVAAASRYAPGGQQVGGPFVKGLMSKTAGRSLYTFARIGTRDATNSFKAYDRKFVQQVGIDSRSGFEIGLELTVKAKRLGLPIAELPTIWLERHTGVSNFKVWTWVPKYLFWYRHAFGRRLTVEELQRGIARSAEDD